MQGRNAASLPPPNPVGILHPGADNRRPAGGLWQRRAAGPAPNGHRRSYGDACGHCCRHVYAGTGGPAYPIARCRCDARGYSRARDDANGYAHTNTGGHANTGAALCRAHADAGTRSYTYTYDRADRDTGANPYDGACCNPNASSRACPVAHRYPPASAAYPNARGTGPAELPLARRRLD